jgi:peptidoglycan/LPS O-acetylase OafA/YrhL
LGYRPELDGVRALAVLAVMIFHVWPYVGGYDYLGGFLGVDVFFVLSGYLITTLLLREFAVGRAIRLRAFYVRRALRLAPALVITLVFAAFVFVGLETPVGTRPYWQSALLSLSYVANWAQVQRTLGVLSHTWSLAIEEQYYLLWPATLLLALRAFRSKRALVLVLLGAAGVVAAARCIVFFSGHEAAAALTTVTRTDGVILGSALALALPDAPSWFTNFLSRREVPAIAGCVLIVASLFVYWNAPVLYQGGLLALNVCAAALIGHLALQPERFTARLLSMQPLPAIGRISYGLYLFHIPMNYLVFGHPATRTGLGAVLVAFASVFALAGASFWLIESRALRLKTRFSPRGGLPESAHV